MIESKGALRSNINWMGLLFMFYTALQDPVFARLFGDWVPTEIIQRLGYVLGLLVMYFRSNSTLNVPVDWSKPLKKGESILLSLAFLLVFFGSSVSYAGPIISSGAGSATAITVADITGTPSAHNWAVWTDADSLEGVAVTASKVVCTDGNGQPTACANLTDIVALSSESDPTVGTQVGSGDIDAVSIGDGNFTVDASGNVLMRTASYIRDDENPFCTQYYSGTNYDDNYTEICAPETGYSEIYRLYWPTAAPTGNQVLVFPAPTLGKSQGTWEDLAGGGDLVSTNNLNDVDNATTARRNLGLEIGVDVSAPVTSTEPIINIALRGGGSAITTGSAGNKRIASAATITGYTITSSASCSITVDLWKTTYTAYDVSTHPVDGDSITASAPITLTTAVKAKDETLTGWTKTLSADDIIHVNVDSADCTGDVDIQVYGTRSL